jgi:hypothetical protein
MLSVSLTAGTIAQAATGPRATIALDTTLRQSANYPNSGSSAVYAGTVRTGKLGRGAIVQAITITAHPTFAAFKFRGTSTEYYSQGTAKSALTGTGTLQPDGNFTLVGRGYYTGGTLYRHKRGQYSFTGTAPPLPSPPPTPPCALPAGWQIVAANADLVVILHQSFNPVVVQEYRYCDYAEASRGFQLLVHSDTCAAGPSVCSTVDGVALDYILYHTTNDVDSPLCNSLRTPAQTTTVYAFDTRSGNTLSFPAGTSVAAAGISPPGVAAWISVNAPCTWGPPAPRTEALQSFSFRTGALTTLDTGDPGETTGSPPSLANLQLGQCATNCPANTVVSGWTHDGTWRYEQLN